MNKELFSKFSKKIIENKEYQKGYEFSNRKIIIQEDPENGVGGSVWEASQDVLQFMLDNDLCSGRNVVELGSGPGMLAIFLSLFGCHHVTASDLFSVVPLLSWNVALAGLDATKLSVLDYEWGTAFPSSAQEDVHFIIACECIYNLMASDALLRSFLQIGSSRTQIILAFAVRQKDAEQQFLNQLSCHFFVFEVPLKNVSHRLVLLSRKAALSISAPGKVLALGGYLVTVQPNIGYVLSVTCRMHVHLSTKIFSFSSSSSSFSSSLNYEMKRKEWPLILESPQFFKSDLLFVHCTRKRVKIRRADGTGLEDNPFLSQPLLVAMNYVFSCNRDALLFRPANEALVLTIVGDDGFYSPDAERAAARLAPKKTGLGSSASLVTCLTAAVLAAFHAIDVGLSPDDLSIVYKMAQFCHFSAQKRIGSGFDVSAAVYGSQIYSRFSPSDASAAEITPVNISTLVHSSWSSSCVPCRLPRGFRLWLGDVQEGAETPGMVRLVDAWRAKQQSLDDSCWGRLAKLNRQCMDVIFALHELQSALGDVAYDAALADLFKPNVSLNHHASFSSSSSSNNPLVSLILSFRSLFKLVRDNLKEMGNASGALIEPDIQSSRCNDTMDQPGVWIAGVPGAGGLDALFVLFYDAEWVLDGLTAFWKKLSIFPLPLNVDSNGLMISQKK